jgi:hypothetical protein
MIHPKSVTIQAKLREKSAEGNKMTRTTVPERGYYHEPKGPTYSRDRESFHGPAGIWDPGKPCWRWV